MSKPSDLFDREQEWADLVEFAGVTTPGLRIGVVYGRRRQGKSFLLRRLAAERHALYHQAQEIGRVPALQRFADDVAETMGLPADQVHFSDWDVALRTALGLPPRGGSSALSRPGAGRLLIIDELPYLLAHSPEIPSVLQELWDEHRDVVATGVIVCGSALSVMAELLSGQRALRGRAHLNLAVHAFDYRTAAQFWGAANPEVALQLGAIMGGTPGYRALVEQELPASAEHLCQWLARNVLSPAHALYHEVDYLLREDPRVHDKALYNSILRAIAAGAGTASKIGGLVGRSDRSLHHPLEVLVSSGFIRRDDDVLLQRRPIYRIADPIVRFSQLVVEPYRVLLEDRRVEEAWAAAASSFSAGVIGPYFERIATTWTARYAGQSWPVPVGEVGHTVVNDVAGRAQHELDVVALPQGVSRQAKNPAIVVLGEAKSSHRLRTIADLNRLEHIRQLLVARGVDASTATLALFGRVGFHPDLGSEAAGRGDVRLIDLGMLFE